MAQIGAPDELFRLVFDIECRSINELIAGALVWLPLW